MLHVEEKRSKSILAKSFQQDDRAKKNNKKGCNWNTGSAGKNQAEKILFDRSQTLLLKVSY